MKKIAALESKLLALLVFFALPLGVIALFFPSPIKAYIISPPSLNFEKVVDDSGLNGRDVHLRFGIFNNILYAGVGGATNSASIYKSSTGAEGSWSEVASFSNDDRYVKDLEEFGGYFYAATASDPSDLTAAEILRSSDGENWVDVVGDGFADPGNFEIAALETFGGYLYASTRNLVGGQIWRSQDGTNWEQVAVDDLSATDTGVMTLFSFGSYLYAGTENYTEGASIYQTSNGMDWSQVADGGLENPNNDGVFIIVSYLGVLYAGTANTTDGLELYYSTDGTGWSKVDLAGDFDTLPNIWPSLQPTIVNGVAYSGTRVSTGSARLYATDGVDATQVGADGFGDPYNFALYALTFFKARIYAGFSNTNEVNCLQIWRSEELPTLSITNNQTLATALVGKSYSVSLDESYGTPPYTFSLTSGSLPPGLSLSSSGLIYGTPTHNSSYTFTVQVTDSGFPAQTYTKTFVLGVSTGLPETGIAGGKQSSESYNLTILAILLTAIAVLNLAKYKKFNITNLSIKRMPLFGRVLFIVILSVGLGVLFNIPNQSKDPANISFSLKPVQAATPAASAPPSDLDQRFQKFGLSIEKIGLKVPITENVDGSSKSSYEKPLLLGLGHYRGTALPGEGSNIFLFGHSTAGPVTNAYYGYTFAKISELAPGDRVILVRNGMEFTYKVTEKSIISKDNLSVLDPTSEEVLTLMTCRLGGESDQRLIVRASLI